MITRVGLLFTIIAMLCIGKLEGAEPVEIPTEQGPVRGFLNGGVQVWLGVPYARPPVGDLRFAKPESALVRTGVLSATAMTPACMQNTPGTPTGIPSEDCLFLNIYSPLNSTSLLPVMVWIHGGMFFIHSFILNF